MGASAVSGPGVTGGGRVEWADTFAVKKIKESGARSFKLKV